MLSNREKQERLRQRRLADRQIQKVIWIDERVSLLIADLARRSETTQQELMLSCLEDGLSSVALKQHKGYSRELKSVGWS